LSARAGLPVTRAGRRAAEQRDELGPLHSIKDCLLAIVERSSWMLPRVRAAKQPSRPKWTRRS
jgi:hypothetical protein